MFRLCLTGLVLLRFRFSRIFFRTVGITGDFGLFILQFGYGLKESLSGLNRFIESRLKNGILFHHAFCNGVCFFNDLGFNFFDIDMGVCL